MALILMLVFGVVIGWLGSVIMRSEDSALILKDLGAGTAGALVAGSLASNFSLLGGMSLIASLATLLGALAAVAVLYIVRQRKASE